MRKFTRHVLTLLAALSLATGLQAQQIFEAILSGQQEVLPVATRASGNLTATLTGATLVVEGSYQNLSAPLNTNIAGGAHLHLGMAGQNGDVVFLLTEDADADEQSGTYSAANNTFTLTNNQISALNERRMYANIHSVTYSGGELRGQLLPQADEYYFANLLGSNEVPSVISGGSGAVAFERTGSLLTYSGSFQNLESPFAADIAGGAHIHVALAGSNGPVSISLTTTLSPDSLSGTIEASENGIVLTPGGESSLEERSLYVNIHSRAFPSGELRGQVVGMAQAVFRTHLSGSNEWPVVSSKGSGQVLTELYPNDSIVVSGSFSDLGSAVNTNIAGGAHIHAAPAGLNGPVIIPITPSLNADSTAGDFEMANNQYVLSSGQVDTMLLRQLYVNIHTMEEGAGEIRGQLLNESQYVMTAYLSGTQEPNDVHTDARGMVKVEVSGDQATGSGAFTNLGSALNTAIAGGAHIHAGYPGQSGPVVFPLASELNMDSTSGVFLPTINRFSLSDGQLDTLRARNMYVNVHSMNFGAGEIRGAILAEATSYFMAPLSGASETNPVNTDATGMIAMEVTGNNAVSVGSFAGLESDFNTNIAGGAHLHANVAGSNGPVLFLLNSAIGADNRSAVFPADSNRIEMTDGQMDTLYQRGLYANIHSIDQPSGEIRGQVLPLAGDYMHTSLQPINEVPPVISSTGIGGLKLELTGDELTVTGSFNNLTGMFDASIGGGAHLHIAGPGSNGDVAIALNATTSGDLLSGYFAATDNTFTLDADQRSALKDGNVYANIHTTEIASGELRGQIVPEINLFPEATTIDTPAEGASVTIEGPADTEFAVTWLPSTDPDDNAVVYIWQLAADAEFDNVVFATNTGSDAFFTTDFATVDALLAGAGVMEGGMATLYHRVVVSDGSNNTPGAARSVNLTRGTLVDINDITPAGFAARAFPTITQRIPVTLEINTDEAFQGEIALVDALGRVHLLQQQNFVSGANQNTINVDRLTAGTYFLFLRHQRGVIYYQQIVVQ